VVEDARAREWDEGGERDAMGRDGRENISKPEKRDRQASYREKNNNKIIKHLSANSGFRRSSTAQA
jgi:hypothetical protein